MECTIELSLFWALVQLDCSLQSLVCEASLKMEISGINVAVPPPVRPFFAQTTTASRVVLPCRHNQLIFGIIFVFIIVVV